MTARAFARALERIRDPALESGIGPRTSAGRSRRRRERQDPDVQADEAVKPSLPGVHHRALRRAPEPARLTRRGRRRRCRARDRTTWRSTYGASGFCLERNRFYNGTRVTSRRPLRRRAGRRSGLARRRHREREVRLGRGQCLERRRSRSRAGAALRHQQAGGSTGSSRAGLRLFHLNTSGPLFAQQPEAEAGDQLRRSTGGR